MTSLKPYLPYAGAAFLLAFLASWGGQHCASSRWERQVQAVLNQRDSLVLVLTANRDSIRAVDRVRDSLTAELAKPIPVRWRERVDTLRRVVVDATLPDSTRLVAALETIAQQDSIIVAQDKRIRTLTDLVAADSGVIRLYAVQRERDSTRIGRLEGLLEKRPSGKVLGFLPKPGPLVTLAAGVVLGVVVSR